MYSKTYQRLIERFGGIEGAREYARQKRAERRARGVADPGDRSLRDKAGHRTLSRWKTRVIQRARRRAREAGMEATIRAADLHWPEYCPVLGVKLLYNNDKGPAGHRASLDRWDNSRGYVPGNVYVISYRANSLKNNAQADEIECVLGYMRGGPDWLLAAT